jgi:hypothetical protein
MGLTEDTLSGMGLKPAHKSKLLWCIHEQNMPVAERLKGTFLWCGVAWRELRSPNLLFQAHMRSWELADVCDWLQVLNFEKYQPAFVAYKTVGSCLMRLTGTPSPQLSSCSWFTCFLFLFFFSFSPFIR